VGKQDGSERLVTVGDADDSGTPFLHIDMDAFYASVEELDDPSLVGKPVLVGGLNGRGVVSAANYVARQFGVFSAMPMTTALRKCPTAIVKRPRFDRYSEVSNSVFEILADFSPLIQPLSIDEAFIDVSGATKLLGRPGEIARAIRERIRDELGLAASIGVASSMYVAKVAGSSAKPDGLHCCIGHTSERELLDSARIDKMCGASLNGLHPRLRANLLRSMAPVLRGVEPRVPALARFCICRCLLECATRPRRRKQTDNAKVEAAKTN
jgi:nucleotidyltransferase/DNA polymerase involved in DNA repair